MPALWICPNCGRRFANRNQSHFCSNVRLEEHFAGRDPQVVATFHRLVAAAEKSGPIQVLPEKTRIAFQVRMSFAAFTLRRRWVDGHVVLARRLDSPRFARIEFFSPHNQLHAFRLQAPEEVDDEVEAWLAEAYLVGEQRHLSAARRSARPHPGS
jgi:hypothetical protein